MTPLNGLVLAGGRSKRMGADKTKMNWHGKEQRYWLADLLKNFCTGVFISCRAEQEREINEHNYKTIKDEQEEAGPAGAIQTALKTVPNAGLLVVACDLPLLDADTIQYLIQHRNPAAIATAYESPTYHLPEPLIAIWESQALSLLQDCSSHYNFSLRKFLVQQDATLISAPNINALQNVNYPAEAKKIIDNFILK